MALLTDNATLKGYIQYCHKDRLTGRTDPIFEDISYHWRQVLSLRTDPISLMTDPVFEYRSYHWGQILSLRTDPIFEEWGHRSNHWEQILSLRTDLIFWQTQTHREDIHCLITDVNSLLAHSLIDHSVCSIYHKHHLMSVLLLTSFDLVGDLI